MKICLVQYNPIYPKVGLLDAYAEVIESYLWGFNALGYEVEQRFNSFDERAVNIVFGLSMPIQLGVLTGFPPNTIIVNLERYSHTSLKGTLAQYAAANYQIWDYNLDNIKVWQELDLKYPVYYARTAYAPCLERIARDVEQDIDVLYYGNFRSIDRFRSLCELSNPTGELELSGMSVVVLSNIYGKQRDEFIARSKVVVNLSVGDIFEIVRVSYLMANRKAVVSSYVEGNEIEADMKGVLLRFKPEYFAKACATLVNDNMARAEYEQQSYEAICKRDIRDVIRGFFG